MTLRSAAREIFEAGLAAGDVRSLVLAALERFRPPAEGRVVVVGAGKASGAMAAAVEEALGSLVSTGVVAVKDGYLAPTHRIRLLEAGHPLPDGRGARAAGEIHTLVSSATEADVVLVLLSGGGSALLPAPPPPISLAEKQALTRLLLSAGADIQQLNAVRKHCSRIKGGQLARAAAPARVHALLLSDVIGDPLDVIASGPTAPDPSTFGQALEILTQFDLHSRTPRSVLERLEQGARGEIPETPKPGDALFERVENIVIGNNRLVVDAAVERARSLGFNTYVLTRALEGEAREVGGWLASQAWNVREGRGPVSPPACLIAGGETTVTVKGAGRGGRCQELALAWALGAQALRDAVLLAAGTDGTDGPTTAAGAIADGVTAHRTRDRGIDPLARLEDNDSHAVFEALGDLVITGPTNTNLLDLYLVIVGG